MIKLIITDVDDTIVPEAGSVVNEEYYEIVKECKKKGILFGVASGRQKPCVQKLFAPVLDDIFILADNGTDIWMKEYKTSMKIPDEYYQNLAKDLKKIAPEYGIMSCKPDIAYFEPKDEEYCAHMKTYPYECEYTDDITALTDICKVSAWVETGIDPEVEDQMAEKWSDKLDVCIAGVNFLDFMSKGCNKGKALSIVQEHYGIKPEETVAFGNADNDIPMIEKAKYSFAVENASDRLKNTASSVIGNMKDDAVLNKIKEILAAIE